MSACQCRCHVTSGSFVSCDVGPEQPGGNQSCAVTHGAEVALDEACVLGHGEPVEREYGYACRRHYHWIDRTLHQILELFALMPDVEVIISGPMTGDGRSGTRSGSPAPGRVEIMAITDRRARPLGHPDEIPDLPGALAQWARMVVEERATTDQLDGTVAQSVRILRRERLWIAQQDWIDDYVNELGDLHRALARAIGDTMWPRPIGKCPNDQTPLYNTIGVDEVTCRRCRATWAGVHLARLRLIHEQEAKKSEQLPRRPADGPHDLALGGVDAPREPGRGSAAS